MNNYDTGRLNLPFVGISTFGKSPICSDWDKIDANVAVMGAPLDMGTQFRAGARFGPRAIRQHYFHLAMVAHMITKTMWFI
jgi:agmatinase